MRRSAWLVIVATSLLGAGDPPPPLPPLNARVEAFPRGHLGRPVGDGICITLAVEALKDAGARGPSFDDPKGDYTWGELVPSIKDVLPGDILQFRDAVFAGKRAIGRRSWTTWHDEYAHHQNVVRNGQDEATRGNVQEGILRMDSLKPGGWVKAYRPVAPGR